MLIREARERDITALINVYRPFVEGTAYSFEYATPSADAFLERFRRVTQLSPWLALEDDGRVVGYAYASKAFERAAYAWDVDYSIYIEPSAHGRGAGRALYGALDDISTAQGYGVAYGLVSSANAPSAAFHLAMGFKEIARIPQTGYKMGEWHDIIWYEKRLRPLGGSPKKIIPYPALESARAARAIAEATALLRPIKN